MSGAVLDLDSLAARFGEVLAAKVVAQLEPTITAAVAQAFERRAAGKILDIPALARRLGKSTDSARMWLTRGGKTLPTVELGGGRRGVRLEDLEAFLAAKPARRSQCVPKVKAAR